MGWTDDERLVCVLQYVSYRLVFVSLDMHALLLCRLCVCSRMSAFYLSLLTLVCDRVFCSFVSPSISACPLALRVVVYFISSLFSLCHFSLLFFKPCELFVLLSSLSSFSVSVCVCACATETVL